MQLLQLSASETSPHLKLASLLLVQVVHDDVIRVGHRDMGHF